MVKNKNNRIPMLMLVIVIAKVIGMLRDVVLANFFGTSNVSDAYLIANSVPTLLFYFIGHALSTAYIPMFNKVRTERGESKALRYSNNLMNIALILCVVIAGVLMLWPQAAVKLFAAGFDEATNQLAAGFIRTCTPSLLLMTLIYIFTGYLQANNQFMIPAAVSIPRNVVVIGSVVLASVFHIDWLGWGLLLAYVAELALLLPFALRKGYRYRPVLDISDSDIQQTLYMILPILLGMCVGQANKIIDRSLASTVVTGGVSALSYASIINNAVQEVLVTGIITVLFADCAKLVAQQQHEKVKSKLTNTVNTMLFLLIPAMIGIILLAEPIVRVILSRGEFDETSIAMTTGALRCYTVGLVFLAIRDTLVKVFYAYKDTKTTTIISIIAIAVNIILNLILSHFWGINGLAIATSISAICNSIMLYVLLRKKIGDFGLKNTAIAILKTGFAGAVMGAALLLSQNTWLSMIPGELLRLMVAVVLGMAVFAATSLCLKNEAMLQLLKGLPFGKKKQS